MARQKTPENKKRKKITVTVDNIIAELLDKYMVENGYDIGDKSRLIENIIKKELNKKNE
jgi:hypothetical protein